MKIEVRNRCSDFDSYRAARVKSLFNAASGCDFSLDADLPVEEMPWTIGVVVGPSGSGKTSIGRKVFGEEAFYQPEWRDDAPIVDCICATDDTGFNDVTAALAAVGLGDVPSWLRPYGVLSNGEKFRADLARIVAEKPQQVVIDEFTSVVDRQIAKIGALAFQKSWRRTKGQAVLLSCHYDVLEWVQPDWVFDTQHRVFNWVSLRRPKIELEIRQTDGSYWNLFAPHHYLKLPRMVAAQYFVGLIEGEPVAHLGVAPKLESKGMRASRLVIMPEWQGAGIGMRFLNVISERELRGEGRFGARVETVFFGTSHPGLCAALRRDPRWEQTSCKLYGTNKVRNMQSVQKSARKSGQKLIEAGPGGHFRAVQGFAYRRRTMRWLEASAAEKALLAAPSGAA